MKKLVFLVALMCMVLVACNEEKETAATPKEDVKEVTTLKVASLIPPMTEILEQVKPILKEDGIELEVVVLGDNVQPNTALAAKEVDANFFQHKPYMTEFNKANQANLVALQEIYNANYAIYSKKYDSWEALPDGANLAIANDASNIDRTLQLLQQHEMVTLADKSGAYYTLKDVVENKKNLVFKEVDLLMLARMYDEADAVVMYPAYAEPLGLTPTKDAILAEKEGVGYAIQLVAREDNQNDAAIQKLKEAMTSETVRNFLTENYKEVATPAF